MHQSQIGQQHLSQTVLERTLRAPSCNHGGLLMGEAQPIVRRHPALGEGADGGSSGGLAAIVSAEVVGYSCLLGRDESVTVATLKLPSSSIAPSA